MAGEVVQLEATIMYLWVYGMFTQKLLGHGSWVSLKSHWLRVSRAPTLGLHEANFRLQPRALWVDDNSNGIPRGKYGWCWLGLWVSVLGQLLQVCRPECALRIWAYTQGLWPPKAFGLFSPWTSLCSHPESWVPWSFKSHGLMPLNVNRQTQKCRCHLKSSWGNCGNNTN